MFNPEHSSYTARIFLNFRSEDSIVSLKFIGGNKAPGKFYKVNISGGGTVSVFESISYPSTSSTSTKSAEAAEGANNNNNNGGRRNEEILKASIHKYNRIVVWLLLKLL